MKRKVVRPEKVALCRLCKGTSQRLYPYPAGFFGQALRCSIQP